MSDYYALLGVPRDASPEAIKKAFRRRARELHPDANPGDAAAEAEFKQLARAYEVLSDSQRRAQYDRFGEAGVSGGGASTADMGFGDIFSMIFGDGFPGGGFAGGGGGPSGPSRGVDLESAVVLDLDEAVFGTEAEVTVRTAVGCDDCEGTGSAGMSEPIACVECGGMGQVRRVRQSLLGQMVSAAPCQRCGGMGTVVADPCATCGGEGRVIDERTYSVEVPAGIDDGQTLRLSGRGAVGPRGGPAGDLFVHVQVQPNERFERRGTDLFCTLDVAMTQAALGAEIELEGLDGEPVVVTVEPGTQTGTQTRYRGRGVPRLDGRGRGDLRVEVRVLVPTGLDAEQAELLERLAELRGEDVVPPEPGLLGRLRSAFR
ncbi:MAG: J domain-containing protein [Acidimicrobiia bacterium]|nr:J domain-containing protein [Acidimicrobiia bacterium]